MLVVYLDSIDESLLEYLDHDEDELRAEVAERLLRYTCRLSPTACTCIEPGPPWENPFVESFNGQVRDELLKVEDFADLRQAQVIVEVWRIEYNTYRPPSALGGLAPTPSSPGPGPSNANQSSRN